jgi:hypothetical protein
VWNSAPAASVMRYRRFLGSIRRTRSPAANERLTGLILLGSDQDRLAQR